MVHFKVSMVTTGNMQTMISFIIYQIFKGVSLTERSAHFDTLSHKTSISFCHVARNFHASTHTREIHLNLVALTFDITIHISGPCKKLEFRLSIPFPYFWSNFVTCLTTSVCLLLCYIRSTCFITLSNKDCKYIALASKFSEWGKGGPRMGGR